MSASSSAASIFVRAAVATPAPDSRIYADRRRMWLFAVGCALAVFAARLWIVLTFGSSLPFWDQWGAEGTGLYKPILEGSYDWSHLWSAHNEHRIALTRLSAIAVFYLNDAQWDARVQCLANIPFVALAVGLFAGYIVRRTPLRHAVVLCALLVLAGALPFSWENTIAGFQNAFYFLILITLATLWIAAHRPASPSTFAALSLLSVLAVFTLATGILALLACCFVLFLRAFVGRDSWRAMGVLMLPPLLAFVVAAAKTPQLDYHQSLKAQGLVELALSSALTTSWPFAPPSALLFAVPFLLFLWQLWRRRESGPVDLFFSGVFAWSALTAVAIAYSRGHGLLLVPSRYTDLLAFGCIAYAYFALRLLGDGNGVLQRKWLTRAFAVGVPMLIAVGMLLQSFAYLPMLLDRYFLTHIEAVNVRAFVEGDTAALVDKPPFYIPFPDANALGRALSDASVRAMLPVSVRGPRTDSDIGSSCSLTAAAAPASLQCGPAGASDAIPLGALSAVSYRLWQWFAGSPLPRFDRAPAHDRPATSLRCALDSLNASKPGAGNVFTVPYATVLRVAGWAGRPGQPTNAQPLQVGLMADNGSYYEAQIRPRLRRDDVVAALKDASMQWAGFDAGLDASNLPTGTYRLLFGQANEGLCDSGHFLHVQHASDERLRY